jgi:hypothetical protein
MPEANLHYLGPKLHNKRRKKIQTIGKTVIYRVKRVLLC